MAATSVGYLSSQLEKILRFMRAPKHKSGSLPCVRMLQVNVDQSSRSQPAIGLKQANKSRTSIFGTIAKEAPAELGYSRPKRKCVGVPQRPPPAPCEHLHSSMACASGGEDDSDDYVNACGHEPPSNDPNKALVYEDGNLRSGSLDALIQHLVPTQHYRPETTYVFAFLLSSRLFLEPHELLRRVCQTCIFQQRLHSERTTKETLGAFIPHMVRLLQQWTDTFAYDFRDERMECALRDMTQRLAALDSGAEMRRHLACLTCNMRSRLMSLDKYEDLLARIGREVEKRLLHIMPTTDVYEVCPSPLVLAQQLTHVELERLSMIGPEEFVQAFVKESKLKPYKDMKKTASLESYVQWFNRLSYFVATEICMHLKKKNRVRMVEYFIDVAKECMNIGNFNSLMAIIAGLSMNSIQRLKKTWGKVNTEKFAILEHQMNPSSNFGSYRSSLKAAMWRCEGASQDREKIVIPFLSLFVKDMYFINEGCANRTDSGHVNFVKAWELAKHILDFLQWKQVECPFDRHPRVLNYILTNPVFSENSLALASFECEAPEKNFEKDRYKSLKEQAGLLPSTSPPVKQTDSKHGDRHRSAPVQSTSTKRHSHKDSSSSSTNSKKTADVTVTSSSTTSQERSRLSSGYSSGLSVDSSVSGNRLSASSGYSSTGPPSSRQNSTGST